APDSTSNLKLRPVPLPHGVPSGPGSVVYSSLFCHHLWSRDVGKRLLFRMTYQRAFLILGFPSRVSRVSTLARWERGNGSRLLSSEPHAERRDGIMVGERRQRDGAADDTRGHYYFRRCSVRRAYALGIHRAFPKITIRHLQSLCAVRHDVLR